MVRTEGLSGANPLARLCCLWYIVEMDLQHPIQVRWRVRCGRLRSAREQAGLTLRAAATASGVATSSLTALEGGTAACLLLSQLHGLAGAYQVSLLDLVTGGEFSGSWENLPLGEWDRHWRKVLRHYRRAAGIGTPTLAERAGIGQATLVRIEGGAKIELDVEVICRLVMALGIPWTAMIPTPDGTELSLLSTGSP